MNDSLSIAICEDRAEDRNHLTDLLEESPIPTRCTWFSSGEQLLATYKPYTFDLIILDIYMDGITGVETVEKLRSVDRDVLIAFASSSTDYTQEGYRLDVIKYLGKPVRSDELARLLALADVKRKHMDSIQLSWNGRPVDIPISSITYLEQDGHKLRVVCSDGTEFSCYARVSELSPQLLEKGFYSGHSSYLVNLNYVQSVDTKLRAFIMSDGTPIPIRRTSLAQAKRTFSEHIMGPFGEVGP